MYNRIIIHQRKATKMNKLFFLLLLTISNLAYTSETVNAQSKPVITFPIKLDLKHNPTYAGINPLLDKSDAFYCNILKISWTPTTNDAPLWRILDVLYEKIGNKKAYTARCMSLKHFANNITNAFLHENLEHSLCFPDALPDAFIREMIENNGKTTRETDNSILHFVLKNTQEELKKLGLLTPAPSSDKVASDKVALDTVVLDKVASDKVVLDTVASDKVTENLAPSKKTFNIPYLLIPALIPAGLCTLLAYWLFAKSI